MSQGVYSITTGEYVGIESYEIKTLAKWFIQGDPKIIRDIILNYKKQVKNKERPYWLPDLKQVLKDNGYEAIDVLDYNIDWE